MERPCHRPTILRPSGVPLGLPPGMAVFLTPFVFLLAAPAGAQEPQVLSSVPSCPDCRILVDTLAVLGDVTGPGMVQEQAQIRRSANGIYLLTSPEGSATIQIFDEDGAFLTQFGRQGEGPGEYVRPSIAPASDQGEIYIFDMALARVTELDAEFGPAETQRLPLRPVAVAALGNERFVVSGVWPRPDRIGLLLHLYDHRSGTIVRSFGADGEAERVVGRGDGSQERRVAVGRDTTIWSAFTNRYRFERWDTAGVLLSSHEREADWFPPRRMRWSGNLLTDPPPPELLDLSEDGEGRVWLLTTRAAENWRPPIPVWTTETHPRLPDTEMNEMYDSVVEVFEVDGSGKRLLVSQAFPERFLGFAAPAIAYMYREDAAGNPGYAILGLRVVR